VEEDKRLLIHPSLYIWRLFRNRRGARKAGREVLGRQRRCPTPIVYFWNPAGTSKIEAGIVSPNRPSGVPYDVRMRIAVTRPVSRSFANCELTYLARAPLDLGLAERQHGRYERMLEEAGCTIHRLRPEPDLPDAVFVEDAAIVLDEAAVITRPGARSRRPEVDSVADALAAWRKVVRVEPPGTIDGGDVLCVGRRIWVGRSGRTNASGFSQLRDIAAPLGYQVDAVSVRQCLHLKSAVTAIGDDALLVNPAWIPADAFEGFALVATHPDEPHAANALRVGGAVIFAAAFPRTADRLRARGIEPLIVDVSEIAKAEGALTCCSLIVNGVDAREAAGPPGAASSA
jgi:dimethylargininase